MARTSDSPADADPTPSNIDPRELFGGPPSLIDRLDGLTGGLASQVGVLPVVVVAVVAVTLGALLLRPGGGQPATAGLPMAPGSLTPGGAASDAPAGAPHGSAGGSGGSATPEVGGGDGAAEPTERMDVQDGEDVTVHVAGAVAAPGIHHLPGGSRVADAVEAAGGVSPGADLDRVNLAATVLDGTRIWIPHVGAEVPDLVESEGAGLGGGGGPSGGAAGPGAAAAEGAPETSPVNINTAEAAGLEALPGVGPATAAAIVSHREANGPFHTVDELIEVRGIGPAKLEQIRPVATV